MKIVRFKNGSENTASYGVKKENQIYLIKNSPYDDDIIIDTDHCIPYTNNILLSPCEPTKIIALAINFPGATGQTKDMSEPLVFIKASNCIVGCNDRVKIAFSSETWGESELGVVIKKEAKNISKDNVKDYILGFVPVNDVSCENVEGRDHHLARSKSPDGYCPVGHWIDTEYDYNGKIIEAYHNERLIRKGKANEMIWNPEKIIIWLSSWMTLYPGDLISTGAPVRTRDRLYLQGGDSFTVKIKGFPDLVTKFYE
jgi:2-keto-4-pentenoate hydratase/2-oxohepta-3-ene-1,7-dioic acid hydratase in catechol pathway